MKWYNKQKINDDDEPELEQKSAAGRQTAEVKQIRRFMNYLT